MIERALSKRWLVFLVVFVLHGVVTRGHAIGSPDTAHYVLLADGLASGESGSLFDVGAVRWTKSLYVSLLLLARTMSPAYWMQIMVVLNVLCSAGVAVMLVEVMRRACRSSAAPAAALLLYLGCYEVAQWMPFVLTDLLFTFLAFIPFLLVARRILIPGEPRRDLLLASSLLLAFFSRPPGVVLVPLVAFVELVLVSQRVRRGLAAVAIIVTGLVALTVRTVAVHDPAVWPFQVIGTKIAEFSGREKTGEVVMDRRETFRPPPQTAGDHVVIVADRFARFFQFTSSAYSRAHNVVNAAYFVPLYGLALTGVLHAFRTDDRRRKMLVVAVLGWIALFAYLYALTTLDFDWRFRMPVMPHLIVLAALAVDALAAAWRGKRGVVAITNA